MSSEPSQTPGHEPAHDVLAAEAFAVPASDPELRRPVQLPEDPSGIAEPHDILAAEEFAMPVGSPDPGRGRLAPAGDAGRWAALAAVSVGVLALLRRRRRRR